jgi:FdhD protein
MKQADFEGLRVEAGRCEAVRDSLSVEAPLQIQINGKSFTISMRTPGDDTYLVKGLLFTEGVVRPEGLDARIRISPDERNPGNTIADLAIPEMYLCRDLLEKRSLVSNSSCGFCGKRELEDIELSGDALQHDVRLDLDRLPMMSQAMEKQQEGFKQTGGCHAAAAFTKEGKLLALFEDIGRHNAVDKVVGYLIENRPDPGADLFFVSGRISFEIVYKVFRAGVPFLAGVSAPSSLAVQMADRQGLTVLGFCRGQRATIYSHPEAVVQSGASA